jgi:hypothetical protein
VSAAEIRVAIKSDQDIVLARQRGRALATELGFSAVDATFIATAVSELAATFWSTPARAKSHCGRSTDQTARASRLSLPTMAQASLIFARRYAMASQLPAVSDLGCREYDV